MHCVLIVTWQCFRKIFSFQVFEISMLLFSELESKRRRAAFLVAFVWFLPAVLTLAAVVTWNCAGECTCPPGSEGELCPRDFGCSRIWPPMTNSFIAVNVALWFVEVSVTLLYSIENGVGVAIAGLNGHLTQLLSNEFVAVWHVWDKNPAPLKCLSAKLIVHCTASIATSLLLLMFLSRRI